MSMWAGTCSLIEETPVRDSRGVITAKTTSRSVPCNVYSIGDAAYFAARSAGIRPEAVLQLRKCLYHGERLCEFEGIVYAVERVNRSSADFAVLTLTERVADRG